MAALSGAISERFPYSTRRCQLSWRELRQRLARRHYRWGTGGSLKHRSSTESAECVWYLARHGNLDVTHGRHVENAQAVAEFLQGHDKVAWVKYAGLSDHAEHDLEKKYMNGTPSAILTFGVKGSDGMSGREAGAKFIDALELITRLVNIGDAKSLACHPASTTHRQLNGQELEQAGVSEDMVRLSIGIEHIDDIKADLEQALAKA